MATLHLPELKKKARKEGSRIVFEDEASFRQDSTLYRTWARRGQTPKIPVTGARKSVKIFGCVDLGKAQFAYARDDVFNGTTYLNFLEKVVTQQFYRKGQRVFYIQDNASYHKEKMVWNWFSENRRWLEVVQLPPYSPEFNAAEPLWHHTRVHATHNTCFENVEAIMESLTCVFTDIQKNPSQIIGYLKPFQ